MERGAMRGRSVESGREVTCSHLQINDEGKKMRDAEGTDEGVRRGFEMKLVFSLHCTFSVPSLRVEEHLRT
jgi:hypothetical protein